MSRTYDTLMDALATLAVEAVQRSEIAVQAYWLGLMAEALSQAAVVTCELLVQRALIVSRLPAWAQQPAPAALMHLIRDETFVVRHEPAAGGQPKVENVSWETLRAWGTVAVRFPRAYQPYRAEVRERVWRLWDAVCPLYSAGIPAAIPQEVARGAVLFDAGFYFACHEYFEQLWGRTGDTASAFYQGLIQVAVALRHLESHNVRGACILLQSGRERLARYPDMYKGIALQPFLTHLDVLLHHIQGLPSPARYRFDATRVPRLLPT